MQLQARTVEPRRHNLVAGNREGLIEVASVERGAEEWAALWMQTKEALEGLEQAMSDSRLGHAEARLMTVLAVERALRPARVEEDDYRYETAADLMRRAGGLARTTVVKAINSLHDTGWIDAQQRGRRTWIKVLRPVLPVADDAMETN